MLSTGNGKLKRQYPFPASPPAPLATWTPPITIDLDGQLSSVQQFFGKTAKLNGNKPQPQKLDIAPRVAELLQAGQYEQAADLLHQAQLAGPAKEDDAALNFLVIAQQMCSACSQYRAEIAWHQQAVTTASKREQELSQQLFMMLSLTITDRDPHRQAAQVSVIQLNPERATGQTPVSLLVSCFGRFQVCLNGQPVVDWPGLKARSIFKYLLVQQSVPVAKDILMELFWPESDPESARHNLHQAIHSLRKTLRQHRDDPQIILFENDCYRLNPELNTCLDFVEFERHIQAGRRLEQAGRLVEAIQAYRAGTELYRGDFLEEDLYEDWSHARREHLRQTYLDVLNQLSDSYLQQGDYAEAITLCQQMLVRDNCHEEAHRRLMRCYQGQGQRHLALRQYQRCIQALQMELDVTPLPETEQLYEQISGNSPHSTLTD